ncbi:MAG TPA: hypothetical protein VF595_09445, partial [Tepidisphaeraceae bacterium]
MAIGGTILSLVLGDRAAVLAQVATDKGARVVQHVGRFDAPGDARLLDRPADTGAALAVFLAGHGFNAKKAVVGVPARWLIAQERELPPVDVNGAGDLLRLAAERLSLAESGTLVADYAGTIDSKSANRVLLVGMLKPQLDKVTQLIEAAGLTLAAVCPTSLAVARVAGGDKSVLRLTDDGAELVLQTAGNPRTLQPLTPDIAALGPELRRTLTMRGAAATDLMLVDGVGLTETQRTDLSGRLTRPPQRFGEGLGVTVDAAARNGSTLTPEAHWPAVALALAAADKRGLPVDFTDTKLAVRPPSRFGRRTIIGAVVAVLAIAGFGWLISTVNAREAEELLLAQQVKDMDKPVKEARLLTDQITYGRTYFDTRPPTLDCLRQLTLAFNFDEPIWATSLKISEDEKATTPARLCVLEGRTTNQQLA